jgi:Flp pilus assembly protein CpaB
LISQGVNVATQPSRPNNRIFLLLGIILAALAFGGVLFALRQSSAGASTVPVVVAIKAIPSQTTLTADMLSVEAVPQGAAAADAFAVPTVIVGRTTTVAVTANTQMVPAFFAAQPLAATIPGGATAAGQPVSLEGSITKGFVALAIPAGSALPVVNPPVPPAIIGPGALGADLVSAGGYIQPGDHIDIIVNTGGPSGGARYSFQDVPVLRVGAPGSTTGGSLLIVEVVRNQAEMLTQLVVGPSQTFVLKYVLRPQSEWGKLAPDNSSYVPNYEDATGPQPPAKADAPITQQSLSSLFGG